MKRRMIAGIIFSLLLGLLLSCRALTTQSPEKLQSTQQAVVFTSARTADNFPLYINELKQYARLNGISERTLNLAFDKVTLLSHVVSADNNQPEQKQTLSIYLSRVLSADRLKVASEKYQQYRTQLAQASQQTQVPARYILALWGMESYYGRYQGQDDVIDALATLAFDGRRERLFTQELLAALTILQAGHIQKTQFVGSWAGAMGQCQFMPSSYLKYGLDGDHDGVIDIWHNEADVFASIGHYLATVGWQVQVPWGNKVDLPTDFDNGLEGIRGPAKTVQAWQQLGVRFADNKARPNETTPAWLILPDDEPANAYLVYANFKTIMDWNRSYYFALSVNLLADSLTEIELTTPVEMDK